MCTYCNEAVITWLVQVYIFFLANKYNYKNVRIKNSVSIMTALYINIKLGKFIMRVLLLDRTNYTSVQEICCQMWLGISTEMMNQLHTI